ncbi:MAG: DinB family protein [Gemmatimonadaceae bacterium]|nr:DinB family protein [Gemmatimonadaceae bacterium]
MRRLSRLTILTAIAALGACAKPGDPAAAASATPTATAAAPAASATVMADLLTDVGEVEKKMVSLAKAIPAASYGYRPAAGVRSVNDVVMHVASDNYFMPASVGTAAPASTGIVAGNFDAVTAFEKRALSPDSAVAQLTASFTFLKDAMKAQTAASLTEKKEMFGAEYTGQQVWIMATTHLHEHLGQLIAYARANNVTPPWSK